jgi:WD40 repeat protein
MMNLNRTALLLPLLLLTGTGPAAAADPPSYAKQVKPFLAKYCSECHSGDHPKAGLNLETYKGILATGRHGPVVVPGKPDDSQLVLAVEAQAGSPMPPRRAPQPKREEKGLVRAWVAAGAKDDSAGVAAVIPDIKPSVPAVAPVAAVAYSPDGKLLAAGTHREALVLDVATGDVVARLPGQLARVTALAFSGDGRRLAVASGAPATAGEVRLYAVPAGGVPAPQPERVLQAHADLIYALAFRPDGQALATAGYDRLIKLWDPATGKEQRVLKDHSDTVYGVAFSPDGKLLASGSADRAVKIWDAGSGARLATLADATDWVYAVAWSPDGRHVAAAGVDRSIRVWDVSPAGNRLVHSVFAHEGPVTRLVYSADGKTLYSLGEDRAVKAWNADGMAERTVYPKQPEAALALAVRPDHKQLAVGRYDGALILVDEATGKVESQPLPAKPKPPQLGKLSPASAQRGQTVRVTFEGNNLDGATEVTSTAPGVSGKVVPGSGALHAVQADVTLHGTVPAGVYQLGVKTPAGQAQLPFAVDFFPATIEAEPNDSPTSGQKINLPATVVGTIRRAGEVDFYRFEARAGDQIGVQVVASGPDPKVDPLLKLTDAAGVVLGESTNGVLGYTAEKDGTYALGIRDRDYRGGPNMGYRLQVGPVPVVTGVYPLGLQRGTEMEVQLAGVNLGAVKSAKVKAPADASPGSRLPVPVALPNGPPLGNPTVVVGEFPEVVSGRCFGLHGETRDREPLSFLPPGMTLMHEFHVPATANGIINKPGVVEEWRFPARKGLPLIVEVNARRIGSPLDSFIEILDDKGQPVPRAVLRCLSKTYTTFRDHDSVGGGIRLETWNDLAINDYLYAGGELMRINALPRNPDDDCQMFSVGGQRQGFLDTTPTHHSLGTPLYKVTIHPPGTTFPPNGQPVFTIFYRNDDGGPGYGKDSRLFFDPPADGEYQVRVGDSRGQGGRDYAYRLTVRPPRPGYSVSFSPTAPAVWKGGAVPVTVNANRTDGFDGPIAVRLENVPPGFSAPPTTIPAGENSTTFALWADATAATPAKAPPLKLLAKVTIDGAEVAREATGGVPQAVEPGDLATVTEQPEVTVRPGEQARLTVRIERRNGFTGRVPLDVRGLPHGVHVLDVGLNGILITERETARTITIACEPWVQPTEHPFVVLSRSEKKNTEHAAQSVLLRVAK